MLLAFWLPSSTRLQGINFIIYYAPRVLQKQAWMLPHHSWQPLASGSQSDFYHGWVALIDKLGRKTLMIIGSIGYIVSLFFFLVSMHFKQCFQWSGWFCILIHCSPRYWRGAVLMGVHLRNFFPTSPEARAVFWYRSCTGWVLPSSHPHPMPYVLNRFQGGPISLFWYYDDLQLIWAVFFMYETRHKSLEQIEKELLRD